MIYNNRFIFSIFKSDCILSDREDDIVTLFSNFTDFDIIELNCVASLEIINNIITFTG